MVKHGRRWETPLASWVRDYGTSRLAGELGLTPQAIYEWVSGRAVPRPAHAMKIIALSRGQLKLEDAFGQRGARSGEPND